MKPIDNLGEFIYNYSVSYETLGGRMDQIQQILEKLPITAGAETKTIAAAAQIDTPEFISLARDSVILSPGQPSDELYVLCEGTAAAYSADSDKQVLLRVFSPHEIFGISNLFTDSPFATRVVAKTDCKVLVLRKPFLTYLIDNDSTVRYQYIAFLAQKTLYLNQKISCLTAGSAEQKLAFWLDAHANDGIVTLDLPMNALCTMLDIGRASLYRAFDKLEQDGFINKEHKTVRILHRDRMLHHYK